MPQCQYTTSKRAIFAPSTRRGRSIAAVVFLAAAGPVFAAFGGAMGWLELSRWIDPCGFKQTYGLPCPACGMVTSWVSMASGRFADALYVQPAGAVLFCLAIAAVFFAFIEAVLGLHFLPFDRVLRFAGGWGLAAVLAALVGAAWAFTLWRAMAV